MSGGAPALARDGRGARKPWAYVPAAILVAALAGQAVMITLAVDDPGFAIERDYYKKGLSWDHRQAQERRNEELGFRMQLEPARHGDEVTLVTTVRDRTGATVGRATVSVEAFENARAAKRFELAAVEVEPGRYVTKLRTTRGGLWEFRFTVQRGAERFTETVRLDLPEAE